MQVLINRRDRAHKLNKGVRQLAVKQLSKLEKLLPDQTIVDMSFEHIHSKRKGKTHYVHASVTVPGQKRPFHAQTKQEDFRTAIDKLYDRLEKQVHRWHSKIVKQRRKQTRKAKNNVLGNILSFPGRTLGEIVKRFRRK